MTVVETIQDKIEKEVRPALQSHGGDIDYVDFDEPTGRLFVRLTGACGTCPFARETLRVQVEAVLMRDIPEVKGVVQAA